MTHRHRPDEKRWNRQVGAEWAGMQAHSCWTGGYCTVDGANLVTDVCRCGAWRCYCPVHGVRWVETEASEPETEGSTP